MKSTTLDIINILALRKVEFLNRLWNQIEPRIKRTFSADEMNNLKNAITKTISTMDNSLFLSSQEKEKHQVQKNRSLQELDLDSTSLLNEFKHHLKKHYPDLNLEI